MTQSNKFKSTIVKDVFPYWAGATIGLMGLFAIFGDLQAVCATALGAIFSMLGLRQLEHDQYMILIKKQRSRVFIGLIGRLFFYAIPIIIGLKFSNYFKFWVILICLFKSQIIFIIREAILNYRQYKKRMNDG